MLFCSESYIFAEKWVKMEQKVIISIESRTKEIKLYPTEVEAAKDNGVSRQAISYAISTGGSCAGKTWKRVDRIYVVKHQGRLMVCRKVDGTYVEMGTGGGMCIVGQETKAVDVTVPMWGGSL